jgi:hypothetical protein
MSSLVNASFDSPSLFECLKRGQRYLDHNAKQFVAETENNLTFKDNFIELLILEATSNWYEAMSRLAGQFDAFNGAKSTQEPC